MTYNVIIGIDVGLSGAISFFDTVSTELLSVYDMPTVQVEKNGKMKSQLDIAGLKFILEIPKVHNENALIVMESIHAFPGQGSVSTGTLMEQKGVIRGIAVALGYDELFVVPSVWQKHYGMIPPKELKKKEQRKKWLKEKSLEIARQLFPEWAETKLDKSTYHGRSDSMLIGNWWIETNSQPTSEVVALPEVIK